MAEPAKREIVLAHLEYFAAEVGNGLTHFLTTVEAMKNAVSEGKPLSPEDKSFAGTLVAEMRADLEEVAQRLTTLSR